MVDATIQTHLARLEGVDMIVGIDFEVAQFRQVCPLLAHGVVEWFLQAR